MEDDDDDEFGDLYTDVLRPISFQVSATPSSSAVAPPPPQVAFTSAATAAAAEPSSDPALSSSSSDGDGDGKGRFLFGSSGSVPAASIPSQTLASPAAAAKDAVGEDDDEGGGWMHDRDPLVAEAAENWGGDQDEVVSFRPADLDVAGSPGESKPKVLEEDNEEEIKVPGLSDAGARISGVGRIQASEEVQDFVFGAATGEDPDELDRASAIPGISTGPLSLGTFPGMSGGDVKPEQSEDWDSDSEDDLQIVLNDNNHGLLGAERNNTNEAEDDDDGEEDLIIVTDEDQHHHLPITDEQQWGEDAMQPTGDGDKKETGDISKTIGAPGTVAGTRASFSGHGFHAQHHSLYKYIRPGATSVTGAPVAGAVLSAARPPLASGPIAGRGRGEWRPAGGRGIAPGQRNYHTGFGVPSWASSSGVRGFGSSLDFTLPAHKSIFDIDIESFDEKPWKYPGADVSDFFNFALDEDKWKDYCKQLEQLRLEATMQSKIRVYESGRSEQEYDPDLPPELAAAAGHHDVSADGGRGKADNGQVDFNAQGRGPTTMRPPMPTGRAIQVESGYGERLPSIDTRPPRIRDSDAIIEIVLQDSFDDPKLNDGLVEQPKKNFQNDRMNDLHGDEEDERKLVPEYSNRFTHTSRGQNRDTAVSEGDSLQSLPSGSPAEYHQASRRSPLHSDTLHGMQNGERLPRGHSRGRCDIAREHSDDLMPGQSADKCLDDNEEEKQADESDINQTSEVSAAIDDTAREPSMEQNSDEKHETIALDNEIADGMNFELHNSTRTGDGKLAYSSKKLKLSSQVEHSDVRDAGDEGDLRASNSDSSRAKSGSSKDYPRRHENSEEVLQGQTSRMGDFQRHHEGEEHRRRDDYGRGSRQDTDGSHIFPKRREDMPHLYQHREWDSNSAHPGRGRSFEKAESELIPQRRREGSIHGRRIKAEDMRGETSDETMARHRGKLRSVDRNNRDGDLHSKKQSEDRDWRGHGREGSSRQREKDNYLMNRRETLDDPLIKRKRDEEHLRDESSKMKNQEDSSQRKRERGDITDHRKRDESTRMREKTEDHYSAKHRDDSWRYKERDDKERLKQSRESAISHREREQRQGVLKTTREGKPLGGDVRYNEELTAISSDKDYQDKDRRMPSDNIRRGERTREDTLPERKGRGNALSHEKQSNTDERSSRQERINLYDDRPPSASNNQQLYKERHRENMKKNKDTGVGEQSSQMLGKRKHEDHGSRRNEKAGMKGLNKSENNNISSATSSKKDGRQVHQQHDVHQANTSLRKQGEEDPTSDDENQQNSRRGRSKLERWTSNKERDYGVIDNKQKLPMPSRPMDVDANDIDVVRTAELPNTEANDNAVDVDAKVVDSGHPVEKTEDDREPHLDTVAKLKRRSERFKLPMPSDKEITSNRKQDNELQTSQGEAVVTDTEVRPERPARKRRWTGS